MTTKAAQSMAALRWANTTKQERQAHIAKMNKARLDKLKKLRRKTVS